MKKTVLLLTRIVPTAGAVLMLGGCAALERLTQIGEQPKLSQIENPTAAPGYKPIQMPMPQAQPASFNPNSLWRNGSRAFFKDQRAHQVGDILTVKVKFSDKATLDNEPRAAARTRRIPASTPSSAGRPCRRRSTRSRYRQDLHRGFHRIERRQRLVDRKEELNTNIAAWSRRSCRTAIW